MNRALTRQNRKLKPIQGRHYAAQLSGFLIGVPALLMLCSSGAVLGVAIRLAALLNRPCVGRSSLRTQATGNQPSLLLAGCTSSNQTSVYADFVLNQFQASKPATKQFLRSKSKRLDTLQCLEKPLLGAPSVSRALPPVGVHSTAEQLLHTTTVCEWLKTVVLRSSTTRCQRRAPAAGTQGAA